MKTNLIKSRKFAVGTLLFSSLLFFSTIFLVNCSTTEDAPKVDPVATQTEIAFQDLSAELDAFNSEFLAIHPTVANTRGPGRGWRIAGYDAGGAVVGGAVGGIIGAIVGGIGASLWAWLRGDRIEISSDKNDDLLYGDQIINSSLSDELGYVHNYVLRKILDEYDHDALLSMDENTLYNILLEETEELGYDTSVLGGNTIAFASKFERIIDVVATDDVVALHNLVVEFNPSMQNEMSIAQIYTLMCEEIDPTLLLDYTVAFRNIIVESDIPDESKALLQQTVSVGAGSSILWVE